MVFRTVIVPLVAGYSAFLGIVAYAWRHPTAPSNDPGPEPSTGALRLIAATAVFGYLVFLAIVLVFHVWLAGEHGAFRSAVAGGGFLAAVAIAVFLLFSFAASRRRSRRG